QIADRALAADRAVISMLRLDAETLRELDFRIAVAPAQEIDDVERLDRVKQSAAAVRFGALQRCLKQGKGLAAFGNFCRAIGDFADADDDGDAVVGSGGDCPNHAFTFQSANFSVIASEAKQSMSHKASMDCFVACAPRNDGGWSLYSSTSASRCSTASIKSSLNSCTTAPADFTLSIRPTPWPTK